LNLPARQRPRTGRFQIAVRAEWPRHSTSRGSPTLTETSRAIRHHLFERHHGATPSDQKGQREGIAPWYRIVWPAAREGRHDAHPVRADGDLCNQMDTAGRESVCDCSASEACLHSSEASGREPFKQGETHDDIMEHLRVRYVITYVSSNPSSGGAARTVKVALVNPTTSAPLRIVDLTGKVIASRVLVQGSYTP
jgi:hypothetical protein